MATLMVYMRVLFVIANTLIAVLSVVTVAGGSLAVVQTMDLYTAMTQLGNAAFFADQITFIASMLGFGGSAMVVGLCHLLLALLGCCSTIHRSRVQFLLYMILGFVFVCADLTLIGYTGYRLYQVEYVLEYNLKRWVKQFDGLDNINTYFFDETQVKLGCCGVSLGSVDYEDSQWMQLGADNGTTVPLSCCELKDQARKEAFGFPRRSVTIDDVLDPTCPIQPGSKANTAKPCLNLIKNERKKTYFIGVSSTALTVFLQMAMIYVAFTLAKAIARQQQYLAGSPKAAPTKKVTHTSKHT